MKEAGYENGFTTSILVFSGEANTQTAEIVQAYLREIGIALKVEIVETSAYWDINWKRKTWFILRFMGML
mgnify:CR=1 FL=1